MSKRYKTGMYETYDNAFLKLKNNSEILTGQGIPDVHTTIFDKRNIETTLLELQGDADGQFIKEGNYRMAFIPSLKQALEEVEERFQKHIEDKMNEGYDAPEEMPKGLLEEKLKLQAKLDITSEEVVVLEKWLKSFILKEEKTDDSLVLKWGLMQSGRLHNNILVELDYQIIGRNSKGTLIIADKRSPYNGMAVSDYRKLAIKWREDEKIRDEGELKKIQAKQREKGLPVSEGYCSLGRRVMRNELPAFPPEYKNYIQDKMVRTR